MLRILLTILCLFAAAAPALAKPSVAAARIGVHADKTRFVMELSESPAYRVFTLPDPYRVVIDLRTHDCDGISDRDFDLARRIDALA